MRHDDSNRIVCPMNSVRIYNTASRFEQNIGKHETKRHCRNDEPRDVSKGQLSECEEKVCASKKDRTPYGRRPDTKTVVLEREYERDYEELLEQYFNGFR